MYTYSYIYIYIYTRPNLSLSSDSKAECRNEKLPKRVKQTGQVEAIAKLNAEVRHCIRRLQEHGRRHQICRGLLSDFCQKIVISHVSKCCRKGCQHCFSRPQLSENVFSDNCGHEFVSIGFCPISNPESRICRMLPAGSAIFDAGIMNLSHFAIRE